MPDTAPARPHARHEVVGGPHCGVTWDEDAYRSGNAVRLPVWPDARPPVLPPTFDAIACAPRIATYFYTHTREDGTRVYRFGCD